MDRKKQRKKQGLLSSRFYRIYFAVLEGKLCQFISILYSGSAVTMLQRTDTAVMENVNIVREGLIYHL